VKTFSSKTVPTKLTNYPVFNAVISECVINYV